MTNCSRISFDAFDSFSVFNLLNDPAHNTANPSHSILDAVLTPSAPFDDQAINLTPPSSPMPRTPSPQFSDPVSERRESPPPVESPVRTPSLTKDSANILDGLYNGARKLKEEIDSIQRGIDAEKHTNITKFQVGCVVTPTDISLIFFGRGAYVIFWHTFKDGGMQQHCLHTSLWRWR